MGFLLSWRVSGCIVIGRRQTLPLMILQKMHAAAIMVLKNMGVLASVVS
jgi:hypothetical protein